MGSFIVFGAGIEGGGELQRADLWITSCKWEYVSNR